MITMPHEHRDRQALWRQRDAVMTCTTKFNATHCTESLTNYQPDTRVPPIPRGQTIPTVTLNYSDELQIFANYSSNVSD